MSYDYIVLLSFVPTQKYKRLLWNKDRTEYKSSNDPFCIIASSCGPWFDIHFVFWGGNDRESEHRSLTVLSSSLQNEKSFLTFGLSQMCCKIVSVYFQAVPQTPQTTDHHLSYVSLSPSVKTTKT